MQTATQLVAAAADGDAAAWNQLTQQYSGLLWAIARGYRLSPADAADVVQTTWLRLVENLDRLRDAERVGAWLAATARHECLRVVRRSARQVPTGEDFDSAAEDHDDRWSPELRVVETERDRLLYDAVEQLPDRCRQLIRTLMADPPPSYEEVSAALDMPVGSIGPSRGRCLAHLRRTLGAAGLAAEDGAGR